MTDAELVQAARENDPDAWQTLCKRYLPLVWRYACALLGDVHAAEDVTSETLLALLKGIGGIDQQSPQISAWLRSVVRHKVADHHRRTYRAQQAMPTLQRERERIENARSHGASRPEERLEQNEAKQTIVSILEKMPERQRLVLELKYLEGLRVKTIAEQLGETEKAVEATLYRARREFRQHYQSVTKLADAPSPGFSGYVWQFE